MAKNVLIVDDSATMRKVIMRSIRQAGIAAVDFQEAVDASEALAAMATTRFDLVLADVDATDLAAVFEKVRAAAPGSPPPIVMVSTAGSAGDAGQPPRGAAARLHKPLTKEQIRRVLGPLLE
jgi:two-component system chemotaxis response regulator CheY